MFAEYNPVFFSLVLLLVCAAAGLASNSTIHDNRIPIIVHDLVRAIKPSNEHGTIITAATIPDWKYAKRDGKKRFIETLLFVDSGVMKFFQSDRKKIRRAIVSLFQGLNLYLHQIDTRVIVVDVMEMLGHDITLEQLSNYRREKFADLPEHDLAILIRYGYEGGIAYVNGICGGSAVGITGFFPEAPMEYGGVFFHELAHLLGLSHDTHAECSCGKLTDDPCLRINGFDECSVQALLEELPNHMCIQSPPKRLPKTVVPLCGNHFIEPGEECDCGPERFCKSLVCNAATCTRTISDMQIFLSIGALLVFLAVAISCCKWSVKEEEECMEREPSVISTKIWDTPTFTPIKHSNSDPEIPVWKSCRFGDPHAPTFRSFASSDNICNTLAPNADRHSVAPPLPPRHSDYVNIRIAKSTENLCSETPPAARNQLDISSRTPQTVERPPRRIGREINKGMIRKPPPIPYLLDFGPLNLSAVQVAENGTSGVTTTQSATGASTPARKNSGPNAAGNADHQMVLDDSLNNVITGSATPDREQQRVELIAALTGQILNKTSEETALLANNTSPTGFLASERSRLQERNDSLDQLEQPQPRLPQYAIYNEQEPDLSLLKF